MNRDEIALQIFCAIMGRPVAAIDLWPELGEKQIRTCFLLADTFLRIAAEPQDAVNGAAK